MEEETFRNCAAVFSSSLSAHSIPQDELAGIRTALPPGEPSCKPCWVGLVAAASLGRNMVCPALSERNSCSQTYSREGQDDDAQALSRGTELDG